MKMKLVPPPARHQDNYSGDITLAYVMECGSQSADINNDEHGDLLVCIDTDGGLLFDYFHSEMSINYEEPPEDVNIMFVIETGSVEAAKKLAEIVLLDIEHSTEARWIEFGFRREVV